MNVPKEKLEFGDIYELIEFLSSVIRHAEAHRETSERLSEAHKYVQDYCMPGGWGNNVWHTILDDAIKMRKQNAELK